MNPATNPNNTAGTEFARVHDYLHGPPLRC